jgi:hypothetical protein
MKISELMEAKAPADNSIWQMEAPFADSDSSSNSEKEAAKFAKRFSVHHKMIDAHGPSGGWPEFVFWGPRSNMEKFAKAYSKGAQLSKEEELDQLEKSKKKYDAAAFTKKVTEAKDDEDGVQVGDSVENIQPMRAGKAYASFGSPAKIGDKGKITKVHDLRDVKIVQFKKSDGSVVYTHVQNLK